MNEKESKSRVTPLMILIAVIVAATLIFGTLWMGRSANKATEDAVREVSLMYLDELAGRREQVLSSNLNNSINNMKKAVNLLTEEDLSSVESLQAFQAEMKEVYGGLEKFAFVDEDGLIYTAKGLRSNVKDYDFDYKTIKKPEISVQGLDSENKTVIIAIPVKGISLNGKEMKVCFEEIAMNKLLEGISLQSDTNGMTFCNIYTTDGLALTDMVLGGLASEDNLLDALKKADYSGDYSYDKIKKDFKKRKAGVVSFEYDGIQETLDYVPVDGTDWMLTYLIRESVITDKVGDISRGITIRSLLLTLATVLALLAVFGIMVSQMRKSAKLEAEREAYEAESRVKQEEMESRIALQEELLEQEKQRTQQDRMITAMAADYRSVYYVDLDTDDCICYRIDKRRSDKYSQGDHFPYLETFTQYAEDVVDEKYREKFLEFIQPENIKKALEKDQILVCRYLTNVDGKETYEMLRMAGVRKAADREDHIVHALGVGFTDIDTEMREQMAQGQALSDALALAEEASKAKTAFLSSMSHEIRTPMNAIIGIDSIALSDPDISEKTRDQLEKIGGSARHLLSLINDILDVSRIESGNMVMRNEEFSFPKLLEQVCTMVSTQCEDNGLEYECSVLNEISDYYIGDALRLKQVLINILSNSVKFTPEGGKVSLTVEKTGAFDGKTALKFVMSDTGIGMDKEFLPKLFDAFAQEDSSRTSKYGSTGLGMAITKNLVEMMNGRIEVDSEKGKGTTFTVTVTLMDSDHPDNEADAGEVRPEDLSVLVIDDDPVACEHAMVAMDKAGIKCETAMSGAEALEKVKLRNARRDPYNLLLVDWKMPEMDGVETSRRIREIIGDDSAIIILTSYNWDDIIDEADEAGIDSFIAKPLFAANVIEEYGRTHRRKYKSGEGEKPRAELEGRRILLAEDMIVNAEIMKEVMKMRGIEVEHAENGRIAVDMFETNPAGYYDAILMDIRMPEMDGLTATSTIRAMDREDAKAIPIIALTANAFDEDVQLSLQAGLNAHLSKPVEPENLFKTLESLIKD